MIFFTTRIVLINALLFLSTAIFAQIETNTPKRDYYQNFDASYIIGAQVFNDNFIYNPGYAFTLSYGTFANKNVGVGLGMGYKAFETESFLPIYAEILGFKKSKSNTPLIKMQVGYSYGWSTNESNLDGYSFDGGLFIAAGVGRKIALNDNFSVMLHWSYQHQFAKMNYSIFNSKGYTETLNYDMIVISLGLIRHQ